MTTKDSYLEQSSNEANKRAELISAKEATRITFAVLEEQQLQCWIKETNKKIKRIASLGKSKMLIGPIGEEHRSRLKDAGYGIYKDATLTDSYWIKWNLWQET